MAAPRGRRASRGPGRAPARPPARGPRVGQHLAGIPGSAAAGDLSPCHRFSRSAWTVGSTDRTSNTDVFPRGGARRPSGGPPLARRGRACSRRTQRRRVDRADPRGDESGTRSRPHGAACRVEDVTLAAIRETRERFETTDLRERLARHHDDPDVAFHNWCDVWLDPAFRSWTIEPEAERVTCPVLLIQGADDPYGTLDQLDRIEAQVRGPARRLVVPGGHGPISRRPSRFSAR